MPGIVLDDNTEISSTNSFLVDFDLVLSLKVADNIKKQAPKHNESNSDPHVNEIEQIRVRGCLVLVAGLHF